MSPESRNTGLPPLDRPTADARRRKWCLSMRFQSGIAHRFVADVDATFVKKALDIPE